MATPRPSRPGSACGSRPPRRCRRRPGCRDAAAATSTAARPTRLWKAATSCGIAVIAMRRAMTAPIPPPIAMPAMISPQVSASITPVTSQRRDRRRSPCRSCRCGCRARAFRARQPAQREDEQHAGDEIERGPRDWRSSRGPRHFFSFFLYIASMRWVTRKPPKMLTEARISASEAEALREPRLRRDRAGTATRDQRADHDHRGDGVGHAHQRRVQRRRHAPHHVIADEDRQHENRQARRSNGSMASMACRLISAVERRMDDLRRSRR